MLFTNLENVVPQTLINSVVVFVARSTTALYARQDVYSNVLFLDVCVSYSQLKDQDKCGEVAQLWHEHQ